jgi:hypothetical protein
MARSAAVTRERSSFQWLSTLANCARKKATSPRTRALPFSILRSKSLSIAPDIITPGGEASTKDSLARTAGRCKPRFAVRSKPLRPISGTRSFPRIPMNYLLFALFAVLAIVFAAVLFKIVLTLTGGANPR